MIRVLMVTPFPPMRGGISSYAGEAVARLREQGLAVAVASPEPSRAELVLDLRDRGAGRRLARLARTCDRLVVQFHPEFLATPDSTLWERSCAMLRLCVGLCAAPSAELVLHEVNYGAGPLAPVLQRLARPAWKLADTLVVHTENERRSFANAFKIDPAHIRVVSQGEHMVRLIDADRGAARAALGLPAEGVVLVSIGFLQPNKGFDRAIRAFALLPSTAARLYVVGSAWRDDAAGLSHLGELRRLAAETPGAELLEGFVSDEEFDRWIVASDGLVLPYRYGWSSNVMERGLLYQRPVLMSRAGGMAEQGEDRLGVTLVGDDAALAAAVRELVMASRGGPCL